MRHLTRAPVSETEMFLVKHKCGAWRFEKQKNSNEQGNSFSEMPGHQLSRVSGINEQC